MKDIKIPFSGRSIRYTQEEIDTVVAVMSSTDILTQGVYRDRFEAAFTDYIGCRSAYAVNNATAALEMAAQLCRFSPGDEVIVPSHTYTSSVYPFIKKGAKVVWADIDPITRVVSPDTIAPLITPHSKAIIIPHLYGYVADMVSIGALARDHQLIVIEDAAQSIGACLAGQQSGSFGDIAAFSFHSHKNITTLGEGGMLVINNEQFDHDIAKLRHNGHCAFSFERERYWVPAMGNVDMPELDQQPLQPNNFCLGEAECALGEQLLKRLDQINQQKRRRAIHIIDALASSEHLVFHREESERHNYHLLVAQVKQGNRDHFIESMLQQGVQCVVQYYPLNRYDYYQKMGYGQANCPNADAFFDHMVSFPFQSTLSDNEIDYLTDAIKSALSTL